MSTPPYPPRNGGRFVTFEEFSGLAERVSILEDQYKRIQATSEATHRTVTSMVEEKDEFGRPGILVQIQNDIQELPTVVLKQLAARRWQFLRLGLSKAGAAVFAIILAVLGTVLALLLHLFNA